MKIFAPIRDFIRNLDKRAFYRYLGAFFVLFFCILAAGVYIYHWRSSNIRRLLVRLNQQREETRSLLQQHELVKQQQIEVNEVLTRDKNFRLLEYFSSLVKELGLERNAQEPHLVVEDLQNGYDEVRLSVNLKQLTMKRLVGLLYHIEKNERVYSKELSIIKSLKTSELDVAMVIATLQAKEALGS
jgi:hypothetical protein